MQPDYVRRAIIKHDEAEAKAVAAGDNQELNRLEVIAYCWMLYCIRYDAGKDNQAQRWLKRWRILSRCL